MDYYMYLGALHTANRQNLAQVLFWQSGIDPELSYAPSDEYDTLKNVSHITYIEPGEQELSREEFQKLFNLAFAANYGNKYP